MKVVRLLDKAEDMLAIDEISRRAFSATFPIRWWMVGAKDSRAADAMYMHVL